MAFPTPGGMIAVVNLNIFGRVVILPSIHARADPIHLASIQRLDAIVTPTSLTLCKTKVYYVVNRVLFGIFQFTFNFLQHIYRDDHGKIIVANYTTEFRIHASWFQQPHPWSNGMFRSRRFYRSTRILRRSLDDGTHSERFLLRQRFWKN